MPRIANLRGADALFGMIKGEDVAPTRTLHLSRLFRDNVTPSTGTRLLENTFNFS